MVNKNFSVTFYDRINQFNKSIEVDSDKSISQRSFIIGSICEGISKVDNVLESEDVYSTINCLRELNCKIQRIKKVNTRSTVKDLEVISARRIRN